MLEINHRDLKDALHFQGLKVAFFFLLKIWNFFFKLHKGHRQLKDENILFSSVARQVHVYFMFRFSCSLPVPRGVQDLSSWIRQ